MPRQIPPLGPQTNGGQDSEWIDQESFPDTLHAKAQRHAGGEQQDRNRQKAAAEKESVLDIVISDLPLNILADAALAE